MYWLAPSSSITPNSRECSELSWIFAEDTSAYVFLMPRCCDTSLYETHMYRVYIAAVHFWLCIASPVPFMRLCCGQYLSKSVSSKADKISCQRVTLYLLVCHSQACLGQNQEKEAMSISPHSWTPFFYSANHQAKCKSKTVHVKTIWGQPNSVCIISRSNPDSTWIIVQSMWRGICCCRCILLASMRVLASVVTPSNNQNIPYT